MDRAGATATQAPFLPSLEPAWCPCDQWPKSNGKTQFKVIIHAVNVVQPCRVENRLGTGRMGLDGQSEKKIAVQLYFDYKEYICNVIAH